MSSHAKWAVAAVLILASISAVVVTVRRTSEIDRLAAACTDASRKKDWTRLETLSREWAAIDSSPFAWYWLGTSLKEQGRFLDAEPAFAEVRFDGPRGIDAAVERMEILFHIHKRPLEAIELARRLLDRDPKLASPRRHVIYFSAMTLQRSELMREIRTAVKLGVDLPEHFLYLMILEELSFRDAEKVTREWAEASPDSSELRIAHLVQKLRGARLEIREDPSPDRLRKYDEIRSGFLSAFDQLSGNPQVLDTRLLLAMDDSDVDAAEHCLNLVTDDSVDDPVFWRYRGWYAAETGDLDEAEKSYRRALELHPLASKSRSELSGVLRKLGRLDESQHQQEVALRGTTIMEQMRHLPHLRQASMALINAVGEYARDCNDQEIANGVLRRGKAASRPPDTN